MIKLGASASAFAKTRFASLPLLLQPATICWEITLSINLEMPLLENMFSHAWIYFHKVEFSSHVEAHKLKININKINIKNQRYTLQVVPEYLLKVKRGGLDHHYSKKKSHFFNPFLNIDLKAFSLLFYLGVFCVCSFQKNLLNFFGCKRIILSPIEHFLLASKSLIAWCKYSQKGNFMLKLKLKTP